MKLQNGLVLLALLGVASVRAAEMPPAKKVVEAAKTSWQNAEENAKKAAEEAKNATRKAAEAAKLALEKAENAVKEGYAENS